MIAGRVHPRRPRKNEPEMNPERESIFFKTAVDAALLAGNLLKVGFGGEFDIEYKGEIDIVTELDRAAEEEIISLISARHPDHGILTEESTERISKSEYRWIIDPLDGTTNFSHGFSRILCLHSFREERGGYSRRGLRPYKG